MNPPLVTLPIIKSALSAAPAMVTVAVGTVAVAGATVFVAAKCGLAYGVGFVRNFVGK